MVRSNANPPLIAYSDASVYLSAKRALLHTHCLRIAGVQMNSLEPSKATRKFYQKGLKFVACVDAF
jgi:hypothetical protein